MASSDRTDDAAARQAAEVAVELSEGPLPEDTLPEETLPEETLPEDTRPEDTRPEDTLRDEQVEESGGEPTPRGRKLTRGLTSAAGRTTTAVTSVATKAGSAAAKAGTADTKAGSVTRKGAGNAAGSAGRGLSTATSWLTGQVLAMGPRLRIRDQATLRAQFPGLGDDEIADKLIERAARAAAAVGGSTGAWAALPVVPAWPAEVAAETLAVIGIEVKLVGELHEVYGMGAGGSGTERARAYLGSWATRRGVYKVDGGLLLVAGSPLAKQLARRLAARVRRSTFSLSPLFTGAVAGALLNRRETKKLGRQMRDELRQQRRTYTATVIR